MSEFRFSPRPNRAHRINWCRWEEETFRRAQREDKPIFLAISAVWCHWCHVMDETSYSDEENINIINSYFIPVRVDNDQRPDINARYNQGGWPTTAFLTPQGDLMTGGTYIPPEELRPLMSQMLRYYRASKEAIYEQVAELRQKRALLLRESPGEGELSLSMMDDVLESLAQNYDPQYGGFGLEPKFPHAEAILLLLFQYRLKGDAKALEMVSKTLREMGSRGIFDREEGGFFRYSTTREWGIPHYEKMLEDNAKLLLCYLEAFAATRERVFRDIAVRTIGYVMAKLYDAHSGAFYGSQDADEEYYQRGLKERKALAPPLVDGVVYTHWNAMIASSLIRASQVLEHEGYLKDALKVLEFLWQECHDGARGMYHFCHEGTQQPSGLLTDNVYAALAMLDAYEATGAQEYLARAETLALKMEEAFGDPYGVGFFDVVEDGAALGNLRFRHKSLNDNAAAALALGRLQVLTHKERYREQASSALRAFAGDYRQYGYLGAHYGLALGRFLLPALEITLVGESGSPELAAMRASALRLPYPNKVIQMISREDKERLAALGYPPEPNPVAYVCFDRVCAAPVARPEQIAEACQRLIGVNG